MNETQVKNVMKYTGAFFMLLFCLFPFFWMILISFSTEADFLASGNRLKLTFTNYHDIITSGSAHILEYLRNSLAISIISAVFATVTASLSAYAVTRFKFKGRYLIPVVLLAFSMFPQISIVGYLFEMMTFLGWINTYPALIFPYITLSLPLALWIMISYFSQLPASLDEAAKIDGATDFQIFYKILLPVSLPGFFSALMLTLIFSFNEFLFALMLTMDDSARTVTVGIAMFEGLYGETPWGQIMASSIISIIPFLILTAFFQRYIIIGLTRGALKE
jgi:multiple sugar transport system permease protein